MAPVIESCSDTDKHDNHFPTPGTWCPGATGAPAPRKSTFVVTIHSGHGSMGEAADPQGAYTVGDAKSAEALCEAINLLLASMHEDEYWAIWFEAVPPPNIGPNSSKRALAEVAKMGTIPAGKVTVDLEAIVNDVLDR